MAGEEVVEAVAGEEVVEAVLMTMVAGDMGAAVPVQVTLNMEAQVGEVAPREQLTMDGLEMLVAAPVGELLRT